MKEVDLIIDNILGFLVERGGFIRKTKKVRIQYPEIWIEVGPEKTRFNNPMYSGFWFNLEVCISPTGDVKTKEIRNTCAFSGRVGLLWNNPYHLYEFHKGDNAETLIERIRDDMEIHLFDFVKKVSAIDPLLEFVDTYDSPEGKNEYAFKMAVALGLSGLYDKSKTYFRKSIGLEDIIRKTALSFGIQLEKNDSGGV